MPSKKPAKAKENIPCHISDMVESYETEWIRKSVCRDLETNKHTDGHYYCILHLPAKEKDIGEFERIRKARFEEVETAVAEVKKLSEDERPDALSRISYDFRYVWFPPDLSLFDYRFLAKAAFNSTTFSGFTSFFMASFTYDANFNDATFVGNAEFNKVTFSGDAQFSSVTFSGNAYFMFSTFSHNAYFTCTAFSGEALFSLTTFARDSIFLKATFQFGAHFSGSTFLESSRAMFNPTFFNKMADFAQAKITGYMSFVAMEAEFFAGQFEKGNLSNPIRETKYTFVFEDEASFANTLIDRPERVSFHTVRLRPNWFVNTDPREMVFTDCRWENTRQKFLSANIKAELDALKERGIPNEKRLLEIACRQLAVNAEENNRYGEASRFRYMAMQTKRMENRFNGWFWTLNWWYWLSSGYGESWRRAAIVLLGIILFFGLMYESPWATFENPNRKEYPKKEYFNEAIVVEPDEIEVRIYDIADFANKYKQMNLGEGYVYSLYVAALQRPAPEPAGLFTKLLVILETIFAPLQAALLALAIRRKYMR